MVSSIYGDGPQNLQHSEAECCFQVNTCQRYKEQDCKRNLLLRADVSTQWLATCQVKQLFRNSWSCVGSSRLLRESTRAAWVPKPQRQASRMIMLPWRKPANPTSTMTILSTAAVADRMMSWWFCFGWLSQEYVFYLSITLLFLQASLLFVNFFIARDSRFGLAFIFHSLVSYIYYYSYLRECRSHYLIQIEYFVQARLCFTALFLTFLCSQS